MKDEIKKNGNNPVTVCLDDIVDIIAVKTGKNRSDAKEMAITFRDAIIESIQAGKSVYIVNGWSFELVPTKAKKLRNPKTGALIEIPARQKIKARISQKLKTAVNAPIVTPKTTPKTTATKKK